MSWNREALWAQLIINNEMTSFVLSVPIEVYFKLWYIILIKQMRSTVNEKDN